MATIEVRKISENQFEVSVTAARGKSSESTHSTHRVTLTSEDYQLLAAGKATPEELIRRSFEFLLERERKESILSQFDLTVIGGYFPEYEREIKRRRL